MKHKETYSLQISRVGGTLGPSLACNSLADGIVYTSISIYPRFPSHSRTFHPDLNYDTAAGAILVLGRDLVMVPKLIHPLPPTGPGTPKSPAYGEPIEEEPPTPHPMTDTWMQVGGDKLSTRLFFSLICPKNVQFVCSFSLLTYLCT